MKDYKKYYLLTGKPDEVYNALTNPATIQLWSGEPAQMSTEPGSEFALWDESISGKNLEFVPGKKIVQEWYFGEQEEKSIVSFIIHDHKHGSSVEVRQTNIPDEDYENIVEGWNVNYFGSLDEFFD